MKAKELVNMSNFKHYRFVIFDKDVNTDVIELKNNKGTGKLHLYKTDDLPNHYDLGYSYKVDCGVCNYKVSANKVAEFIDYWKVFKISQLEYCQEKETLFIHLKVVQK